MNTKIRKYRKLTEQQYKDAMKHAYSQGYMDAMNDIQLESRGFKPVTLRMRLKNFDSHIV